MTGISGSGISSNASQTCSAVTIAHPPAPSAAPSSSRPRARRARRCACRARPHRPRRGRRARASASRCSAGSTPSAYGHSSSTAARNCGVVAQPLAPHLRVHAVVRLLAVDLRREPGDARSSSSISAAMRISSATSYSQRRAIVCAQSSRRSSTSGAQRYSSSGRSNASASASSVSSSYTARACPISFCAIDENATSSSSIGAIPVHSESRQPMTSSSSARPSSSSFTRLLQARLDRVAVDAPVLQVELVGPVARRRAPRRAARATTRPTRRGGRTARAPTPPRTPRPARRPSPRARTAALRGRAGRSPRSSAASTASRTHCSCSRKRRAEREPLGRARPVAGDDAASAPPSPARVYSQTPSSRLRSFGSGTVRPSSRICGT